MSIIDNPIFNQIRSTIQSGPKPVTFTWTCVIHANGEDVSVQKMVELDFTRDYVDNYTDVVLLNVMMLPGVYQHDVYPYRDSLEVTVTRRPAKELVGENIEGRDPVSQRFRAVLVQPEDELINAATPSSTDKETANLKDMKYVQFQLLDLPIEQIRMMSTGGIFRKVKTSDVIRFLMAEESRKAIVPDDESVIGVDVAPGASERLWNHVIVPHHTNLIDLPHYIHREAGGVFTAGMGSYLQHRVWYIYPPFNIKRYEQAENLLTVLNVPSNLIPGVERTYRVKGNQVFILSTGDTKNQDMSEQLQQNDGNGVRYANADRLLESFGVVSDNRVSASRKSNNVEVMIAQRASGLNNIKMAPERVTNNHPLQMSRMAPRNGQRVQFTWESANTRLIQPGMPTRFLTVVGDGLMEYYGTVIAADYGVQWKGTSLIDGVYMTTAAVTLFLERKGKKVE